MENNIIAVHNGAGKEQNKGYNMGRVINLSVIENIKKWKIQLKAELNQVLFKYKQNCECRELASNQTKLEKKPSQANPKLAKAKQALKKETKPTSISPQKKKTIPIFFEEKKLQKTLKNPMSQLRLLKKKTEQQDVSFGHNPAQELVIREYGLMILDLQDFGNLLELNLQGNKFEKIDLSHCPRLATLNLGQNYLFAINLTSLKQLSRLDLRSNKLQQIDLSLNTNLTTLKMTSNRLKQIDLKNNINLTNLQLHDNQIQTIDLSNNTRLVLVNLCWNRLARVRLNITENVKNEQYIEWFDFSGQNSSTCSIQVKSNPPVYEKAQCIVKMWRSQSQYMGKLKKCQYSFKVV